MEVKLNSSLYPRKTHKKSNKTHLVDTNFTRKLKPFHTKSLST